MTTQANAIGLNVVEREQVDTPNVVGPPIGRLGAVFTSERGPVGVPVKATSLSQAKKYWDGRRNVNFNCYYCLRGLFRNAAQFGAEMWGVRVDTSATTAATPATVTGNVVETFELAAGDTIVIDTDNGGDETATFDAAPAQKDGAAASYPANFSGGETLIFEVDNSGEDYTVTFTANGTKSLLEVLAEINAVGAGFAAKDTGGGQLRLESDREGTGSQIDVKAGSTALALLGLTAGAANGTGDVSNIKAVTAAEVKTVIEADTTGLTVSSDGGKIKFTGTTTGVTGEVDIKSGNAVTKLGHAVGTTNGTNAGSAAATPASLTLNRSATPVWTFTAGFRGYQDPGTWANDRVSVELNENLADSSKRDVVVYYKAPGESVAKEVETWPALDASNVVATINNPTQGSEYVVVNIEGGDTGVPDAASAALLGTGTAGVDAQAVPTNTDYENALAALNGLGIELTANLDLDDATWQASLESYCAGRDDVTGLFATPQGASVTTLKSTFGALRIAKSRTAGYRAYGDVSDGLGGSIKIPLLGHIVGAAFIRKARESNDKPHTAPAGSRTYLLDVLSVDNAVYDGATLKDLANNSHINPVVFESGKGYYVKTSRTMSTTPKWLSIHVRLLTNHIKVGFINNLGDFEQEGNTPDTRRRLRDSILPFMEDLDNQDAFEKEGGFENNVAVVCNNDNNPKRIRQQRRLVCDVTYRPAEIAEEVQINVTNTSDGILIAES